FTDLLGCGGVEPPPPPPAAGRSTTRRVREPGWTPRAASARAVPSGERGTSGRSPRAISPGAPISSKNTVVVTDSARRLAQLVLDHTTDHLSRRRCQPMHQTS